MTVIGRRSASAPISAAFGRRRQAGQSAGGPAASGGRTGLDVASRAAIASRSFRRWPTIATPMSFRSSAVSRQEVAVDRVVAESRFVLAETEVLEPGRDVHVASTQRDWG